ncbi:hypothetical protein CW304_03845 [Bacillus sp. UFRGS-B20]|nr:hypothetical protein CW304_03845 [Bacillus sp. UFRGS-B20]
MSSLVGDGTVFELHKCISHLSKIDLHLHHSRRNLQRLLSHNLVVPQNIAEAKQKLIDKENIKPMLTCAKANGPTFLKLLGKLLGSEVSNK